MVNEKYSIAMCETLRYLKGINQDDLNKIPSKFIKFLNPPIILLSVWHKYISGDFAVLVNTTIIDAPAIRDIIAKLDKNEYDITQIFNITNRHIKGVTECRADHNYDRPKYVKYIYGIESVSNEEVYVEPSFIDENIRIGYSKDISLGMKHSVFRKFFYW